MAQILSLASAFNPGSDLWIVPDTGGSRWNLRLDWYLNYQILRSSRRGPVDMPGAIQGILDEIDWEMTPERAHKKAALLISSDGRLPSRWVAVVPDSTDTSDWVERVTKVWREMQKPSLKVFLPTGLQAGPFTEEWKRHSDFNDFSVVLDQDPQLLGQ